MALTRVCVVLLAMLAMASAVSFNFTVWNSYDHTCNDPAKIHLDTVLSTGACTTGYLNNLEVPIADVSLDFFIESWDASTKQASYTVYPCEALQNHQLHVPVLCLYSLERMAQYQICDMGSGDEYDCELMTQGKLNYSLGSCTTHGLPPYSPDFYPVTGTLVADGACQTITITMAGVPATLNYKMVEYTPPTPPVQPSGPCNCPSGTSAQCGVCQAPCADGHVAVGDQCWQSCPADAADIGLACVSAAGVAAAKQFYGVSGSPAECNFCYNNPCGAHGTCTSGASTFSCSCNSGYTGNACEININECASGPCQHHGTCIDGISSFTCACASGWTGTTCTVPLTNPCTSNPCKYGGTCVNKGDGTFECACPDNTVGLLCENTTNCNNTYDRAVFTVVNATFSANMTTCSLDSYGSGATDIAAAINDCLWNRMNIPLTANCMRCFGGIVACSAVPCYGKCYRNPSASRCRTCVNEYCQGPFELCAGLPMTATPNQ